MYRNSRRTVLFPLAASLLAAAGLLLGQAIGRSGAESRLEAMLGRISMPQNKLSHTVALIAREYVDELSVDSLIEMAIPVLVGELDPHSVYVPASEMQEFNEPLEGEFDGIGVVFNMATDTIVVLNVVPAGPSDRAGVRGGDRIMLIDDSLVAGRKIPQMDIVKRLRGPRGTQVRLSLARRGIDEPVEVTVTRDAIPIKSIDAAMMLDKRTGYIRLSRFARTSGDELSEAIESLRGEGMKGLILDLRGNSGGYLDQAIAIADEFLPEGRLIVYTEDRNRQRMSEYSDGNGSAQDIPLAVLIDEESASSSEILAGALQDNDRGTIIGRRSFGKGLVQRQIPYSDGSALRLTVARYYTPSGRSIQKPYKAGEGEAYGRELIERYVHSEYFSADSIRFDDSLRYTTLSGRTVYGGGGIMPDEFVPLDTTRMTRYFVEVSGRNIIYRYAMDYADRHREALNSVRSVDELRVLLDADRGLFADFVNYAAQRGVAYDARQAYVSREIIVAQLRAYIGRNTPLEDAGFYAMIYPIDPVLKRAVEVLSREEGQEAAQ